MMLMPVTHAPAPNRSSKALDMLLETETPEAKAIRKKYHRTALWRLRTGRRQPELRTAFELNKLSKGAVSMDGWLEPARG